MANMHVKATGYESNTNVKCPHCGQGLYIYWDLYDESETEGDSIHHCPKCSQRITINTEISVTYTAR